MCFLRAGAPRPLRFGRWLQRGFLRNRFRLDGCENHRGGALDDLKALRQQFRVAVVKLDVISRGEAGVQSNRFAYDKGHGLGFGFADGLRGENAPLCNLELSAYYYRNDYMGVEQYSRYRDGADYVFVPPLYEEHRQFARLWDRNLRAQGFPEAFTDKSIRG